MKRIIATIAAVVVAVLSLAGYQFYLQRNEVSVAESKRTLPARLDSRDVAMGQPAFIRIFKQESILELWMKRGDKWLLFQDYPICRWSGTLGPKLKQGDRQSPEGFYRVALEQLNPYSRWHLSFNLGFPNAFDKAHGRTGSFLMVHGGCSSAGCYAMTNGAVDDIYRIVEAALRAGQPAVDVHIFPFRMTAANMARHKASRWAAFWRDLKRGYDVFEAQRAVPKIKVVDKRYVVDAEEMTASAAP
jgi:murein L,D-transpeptidase YafK